MRDYIAVYQKLIDSIGEPKESQLNVCFSIYKQKSKYQSNFCLFTRYIGGRL